MCGDLLQSKWENAYPWAQFSALLLCVHNVVLHLLVGTSVTTVICWELSFYVVFPQLLNSHQCLIQVPFLVVHSEPLHGSSAPPACTPGHGKDSLQVHLFMHLLGYPSSVTGHYPTDFLFFFFFFFQLLTPGSVSQCHLKSLLGQGDTSLWPLTTSCSSL